MARMGIPMYRPLSEVRCFVTIEDSEGTQVKLWKGRSFAAIKRRARAVYGEKKLHFGRPYDFTL